MFSVMKSLPPTHVAVERANVRSLRGDVSAVGHWGSSMVTGLSWRSAFLELSGQLCVWSKELMVESNVFSAVIGVFAGLTSASVRMHRNGASRSQFVKGVPERASEVGRVSERTRFKRSSKSCRARSRALRSIALDVGVEYSSSAEDEVSLAMKESCADPWEWRLTAYGAFFRDEDIIVLEARSILHAVRYAESCYPPGRLPIVSGNLALVLALCKGCSNKFTLLSVMRRIFASVFRAGFVLSFRLELNYSDKGSRFFDRGYDWSKSLLHVLAQCLPRISPARTCDQDWISRSLIGEVDLRSHIHVPTVSVPSYAKSDL